MADVPFATNLLPQYQSPQQMQIQAATAQNLQANSGYTQAQTQGQDITNQSAALKLGLLQNYLQGTSPTNAADTPAAGGATPGATVPGSSGTIGGTNYAPEDVTKGIINQFAPIPTARPASVTAQMQQATLAGLPDFATSIGTRYDAQVQGVNQQRQLGANAAYQMQQQIASAPAGAAFETLNRYEPEAAAAFKAQHPSDDPDQLDADVRLMAQHTGIAVHQYTGRDTDFQNGVLVDKQDGKPVLGSQQVLTGLDAAGKEKAFGAANDLVTVQNSDGSSSQVPRWKQSGFSSAEGYVVAADKSARSSATDQGSQNAAPAASGAPPGPSPNGNTSATYRPSAAPATPAAATADPVLKAALSDPEYKLQTPPVVAGRTPTPAQLDQQKATVQAKTDLLKDSSDATQAASQSLQYLNAAKSIMDSKGATVGAYGGLMAGLSKYTPFTGDATNYQEVAKYLGNAALANAKGIYGSRMSTSEVGLQLNELSPSTHMTDDAVNNLIGNNIKSAQYTIDSAKRSRAYIATGGDPQNFSEWNQQYYPREKVVGAPARPGQQASGGPGMPSAGTVRGGYRFTGGDPSNKASWVKQ